MTRKVGSSATTTMEPGGRGLRRETNGWSIQPPARASRLGMWPISRVIASCLRVFIARRELYKVRPLLCKSGGNFLSGQNFRFLTRTQGGAWASRKTGFFVQAEITPEKGWV